MRANTTHALGAVILLSLCFACGSTDAGAPDAGSPDAGNPDAGCPQAPPLATTYYIIRHTERDPGEDPPINAEGIGRAERLADALEEAGIDEIITTMFIRGQQSGQPLSDRTGAPITVAPFAMDTWPQLATDVAGWQIEREVEGATYLMIGHSGGYNSTLIRELGGPSEVMLAERYQDLVILIREPDDTTRLSVLQYGGASSLDP